MEEEKQHIYLCYDVYYDINKIGSSQILIHKEKDLYKWANPNTIEKEALAYFKKEHPMWENYDLRCYYKCDLVPYLERL